MGVHNVRLLGGVRRASVNLIRLALTRGFGMLFVSHEVCGPMALNQIMCFTAQGRAGGEFCSESMMLAVILACRDAGAWSVLRILLGNDDPRSIS